MPLLTFLKWSELSCDVGHDHVSVPEAFHHRGWWAAGPVGGWGGAQRGQRRAECSHRPVSNNVHLQGVAAKTVQFWPLPGMPHLFVFGRCCVEQSAVMLFWAKDTFSSLKCWRPEKNLPREHKMTNWGPPWVSWSEVAREVLQKVHFTGTVSPQTKF